LRNIKEQKEQGLEGKRGGFLGPRLQGEISSVALRPRIRSWILQGRFQGRGLILCGFMCRDVGAGLSVVYSCKGSSVYRGGFPYSGRLRRRGKGVARRNGHLRDRERMRDKKIDICMYLYQ